MSPTAHVAVLLFRATSDEPGFAPLYEERFHLLLAQSLEEASQKAEALRLKPPHSYQNADGFTVTWQCLQVVDVAELVGTELTDGAELYGRYFRDVDAYERFEPHLKGQA